MRITLIAVILLSFLVIGCTEYKLPAVGQAVYCPRCDANLYQRVSGTSRTAFRRNDYAQMRYDMSIPYPGEEAWCPLCNQSIVERNADGDIIKVFYRDISYWDYSVSYR